MISTGVRFLAALVAANALLAAQSTAGRLLVLNKEDATLAIVDPASGKVLGTVPTGPGPHELVTSTDGRLAFASNYGTGPAPGHTISMIDLASQKELRRIDVAPLSRPHGLAFANGKLYFSAEADKKIARYDPATNRVDWQFETGQAGTHMVLPTRDARTIQWFTCGLCGHIWCAPKTQPSDVLSHGMVAVAWRRQHGQDIVADVTMDGSGLWSAATSRPSNPTVIVRTAKQLHSWDSACAKADALARQAFAHACLATCGEWLALDLV